MIPIVIKTIHPKYRNYKEIAAALRRYLTKRKLRVLFMGNFAIK